MPSLKVTVTNSNALGSGLESRIKAFQSAVNSASGSAARIATSTSQAKVKRVRDLAPPRRNRYHGLRESIKWGRTRDGGVALDKKKIDQDFKPWLVQEIGTGERATQRVAGQPNPKGRPKKNATYIKTVKAQRGRRISTAFVFAGRGGDYSPPGAGRGEQLYLRSQIQNLPPGRRPRRGILITKEIKGQHFIRDGGKAGSREYRRTVLAAARSQFKKKRA